MKKVLSFVISLTLILNATAIAAFADYQEDISECVITLWEYFYVYSGSANKPEADIINTDGDYLVKGVDYELKYSNNINAGTGKVTAYGIGEYTGEISETFTIARQKIKSDQVYLWYDSVTYSGKAKKPSVSVYYPETDSEMAEGKHYKLTYKNNVNPGTAKVTVTGIGNYTGTVTRSFKIKLPKVTSVKTKALSKTSIKISWKKQSNVSGYQIQKYNLKKHKWSAVKTISKNTNSAKLTKINRGTKYKFRVRSYKKIGSKKYYGAYSKTKKHYVALPKKIKGLGDEYFENTGGMFYYTMLSWNKQSGVTGYQVRFRSGHPDNYSTYYYKLKGADHNYDSFEFSITRIPEDKPFYSVRAYTYINGKTYYGPWTSWT